MVEQVSLMIGYAIAILMLVLIIITVKRALTKAGKKILQNAFDKALIKMFSEEVSEDKYTYYFFITDEFFTDLSIIAKRVFHDQLPINKIISLYMIGCTPEQGYIVIRVETEDRTKVSMSSYNDIRDVYDNTPFKKNVIDWHEWYKAVHNKEEEQ